MLISLRQLLGTLHSDQGDISVGRQVARLRCGTGALGGASRNGLARERQP